MSICRFQRNKLFKYFPIKATWNDARNMCKQNGGDLASIKDSYDQMFVFGINSGKQTAWVGGSDSSTERDWKWPDGTRMPPSPLVSPGSFSNWLPGSPIGSKNENCMYIHPSESSNRWHDGNCNSQIPFICEYVPFKQYFKSSSPLTWEEANSFCRQMNSKLLMIKFPGDFEYLSHEIGNDIWLGSFQRGNDIWKWYDGSEMIFTQWDPSEPSGSRYYTNYLKRAKTGRWFDEIGSEKYHFVCETFSFCPSGHYCTSINSKIICPSGHTCPNGISTEPNPCPKGSYCPRSGMTSSIACEAGKYCPNIKMTAPIVCPAGSYCPGAGRTTTIPCPAGSYCPGAGRTTPIPCPAGSYCPGTGRVDKLACPAGSYCPNVGMSQHVTCPAGSYCPGAGRTAFELCPAGSYCPGTGRVDILACPAGSYCPKSGESTPTICPAGSYCPGAGRTAFEPCLAGSYCPGTGRTTTIPCPAGKYCPNNRMYSVGPSCPYGYFCPQGSSAPQPSTKTNPSTQDFEASSISPCNNGIDCYKYLPVRPILNINTFEQAMSSSDVSNTLKVSNVESGTKINTSAARTISNGKQIIVECKKGLLHTPIYLENPLTLSASADNVYNKIVFRNCLVIGSIIMNAKTVIILDNSSLALTPKISNTNGSPSYIVMMDNSHLAGLDIPSTVSERNAKNFIIDKDGGANSVYGCDPLPKCNQAMFLNSSATLPNPYRDYYSERNPMWYDTNQDSIPSGTIASTNDQKLMSIQSLMTCGAIGSSIHPQSTYLSFALYCGITAGLTVSDELELTSKISTLANLTMPAQSDPDYQLIDYAKQVANARRTVYESADMTNPGILIVPRVSVNFLTSSAGSSFSYSIPNLSQKLDDIANKIESLKQNANDAQLALRTAIRQAKNNANGISTINGHLSESTRTLINNQVTFMKNVKSNSKVSYDNTINALGQAKQQLQLSQGKFSNIDTRVSEFQQTLNKLKNEMEVAWRREVNEQLIRDRVDFLIKGIVATTKVASSWKAGMGDIGAVGDAISASYAAAQAAEELVETYKKFFSTPAFNSLQTSATAYKQGISRSLTAIKNYINGNSLDISAFSMPISEIDIWRDAQITFLRSDSGCDGTFPALNNLCERMYDAITAIALLLKEKNENMIKVVDALMRVKLLTYEKEQYEKNIQNWNDGIQAVADSGSGQCKFCDTLDTSKSFDDIIGDVQKAMYAGLSRSYAHSVLVVGNAIAGLRTICRASAYQYPGYLSGIDATWNKYCSNTLERATLEGVQTALSAMSTLMEKKWVTQQSSTSILQTSMEITDLVPFEFYKNPINFQLDITPELYGQYSPDETMASYANVLLMFVTIYATDASGNLIKPSDPNHIYNNFIHLRAPFTKESKENKYLYNIEDSNGLSLEYKTQIFSTSTPQNLWEPQQSLFIREGSFAFETPYCVMDMSFGANGGKLSANSRYFVRVYFTANEKKPPTSPTKYPSNVPTSNPSKESTKHPSRNPSKESTKHPSQNQHEKLTENPTTSPSLSTITVPIKDSTKNSTQSPTQSPTKEDRDPIVSIGLSIASAFVFIALVVHFNPRRNRRRTIPNQNGIPYAIAIR